MTLGKYDSNFRTKELGLWKDLKKMSYKLPTLQSMTLQQTKKTTRACYTCYKTGWQVLKLTSGKVIQKPCDVCNGDGVVYN